MQSAQDKAAAAVTKAGTWRDQGGPGANGDWGGQGTRVDQGALGFRAPKQSGDREHRGRGGGVGGMDVGGPGSLEGEHKGPGRITQRTKAREWP